MGDRYDVWVYGAREDTLRTFDDYLNANEYACVLIYGGCDRVRLDCTCHGMTNRYEYVADAEHVFVVLCI